MKFSKSQILASERYAHCLDRLNVVLEESQFYTLKEVDVLSEKFMKGKVSECH